MTRCGYLDANGKQCMKRDAVETKALHLEGDLYSFIHDPDSTDSTRDLSTWVAVPLCRPHSDALGSARVIKGKVVPTK